MGKNPVTRFLVTPLPVTPLRVLLTTQNDIQKNRPYHGFRRHFDG